MLYSRILAFVSLAASVQSAPTLPAKDLDRKGVMQAFEVGGASTAKMAAENVALKTENVALKTEIEELKAMLKDFKAKNHESESVTGLEVHKNNRDYECHQNQCQFCAARWHICIHCIKFC